MSSESVTRNERPIAVISGAAIAFAIFAAGAEGKPPPTFRDCEFCPELVEIGPGEFDRADAPNPWVRGEVPRGSTRTVRIPYTFAIGRYEVTVKQYQACVDAGACGYAPEKLNEAGPDHPVVDVSWSDAQNYVRWLSESTGQKYRLPTEAEWEYAARGGANGKFIESDSPEGLCVIANISGAETRFDWANDHCRDDFPQTAPVGSFKPNSYGLYDVSGNIWEWVEDCFHDAEWESRGEWTNEYQKDAPLDGSAYIASEDACRSRIMRGGSWRNGGVHVFSPQYRNFDYAAQRYPNLGFRVARDIHPRHGEFRDR